MDAIPRVALYLKSCRVVCIEVYNSLPGTLKPEALNQLKKNISLRKILEKVIY